MAKKKMKNANCRVKYHISRAGHLLRTKGYSGAGTVLATQGKAEKRKRKKRGCLNGTDEVFYLTDSQKKRLPVNLQKAIKNYHRRLGKRIID